MERSLINLNLIAFMLSICLEVLLTLGLKNRGLATGPYFTDTWLSELMLVLFGFWLLAPSEWCSNRVSALPS